MSAFIEQCFLFLRAPDGGVEDLQRMQDAGFGGVFCNVRDYPVEAWEETVRPRALGLGMFCGPWGRTCDEQGRFDYGMLDRLVFTADDWASPLIVNSESELKGSGSGLTREIAETVGNRDAAVSMEAWPFANVDWTPLRDIPVLPQFFGESWARDWRAAVDEWHRVGVRCVFPTWGTYSGWTPGLYDLNAPYSLYTGDDCGNDFAAWSPTSYDYLGCVEQPVPPDGGGMEKIGSQHGVTASMNRLRTLDPEGTLLVTDEAGVWPSLDTLQGTPLGEWRAYDKLERTLTILVEDHDASAAVFDGAD